ncbi:helix-turn-helix domain-containing protein [Halomonas ramblicola]|uniref:helix-turn-helix domain-containing protein n=1 Tax=Halomonas ramblicola TaxID=747349 RepID=UPI00338FE79F
MRLHYEGPLPETVGFLLTETDMDVLAIGLACGFTSGSSFSRAFREHYGYSPRGGRRQTGE